MVAPVGVFRDPQLFRPFPCTTEWSGKSKGNEQISIIFIREPTFLLTSDRSSIVSSLMRTLTIRCNGLPVHHEPSEGGGGLRCQHLSLSCSPSFLGLISLSCGEASPIDCGHILHIKIQGRVELAEPPYRDRAKKMDQVSSSPSSNVGLVGSDEGTALWIMGVLLILKSLGNETGGSHSTNLQIVPPQQGPVLHMHTREEETVYILEGEVEMIVGGRKFNAKQGDYITLLRNVPHTYFNKFDKQAQMLHTYAPGGFEQWFLEFGIPVPNISAPGPPAPFTRQDRLEAKALAVKYGLHVLDEEDEVQEKNLTKDEF